MREKRGGPGSMIPERSLDYAKYKLRKSLRKWGLWGTVKVGVSKAGAAIRSATPRHRRARAIEREFDRRHGVETEYVIPPDDLDVSTRAKFRRGYQATPVSALHTILNTLQIAYDDFLFVDLGSGMGKALLMASQLPFKKIIGVECSSELHRLAQHNVRNFRSENQRCRNIELVCRDAVEYPLPAQNTVFYLFNPFEQPIMENVLENIRRSLQDHPHKILIAYYNAKYDLTQMAPFLEKVLTGEAGFAFEIYQNREK